MSKVIPIRTEDEDPVWEDDESPAPRESSSVRRPRGVTAERSDIRNAERLVELHGEELLFVGTWGKGLAWDGKRWALDECGSWHRCAVQTARVMLEEALEELRGATAAGDEQRVKQAKAKLAWAMTSQGVSRLAAMVSVARSTASIAHDAQATSDADPWLLNVANGTIDLRTGELREHQRRDFITKLAPVAYEPDAKAPTWDAFLARAMGGSDELAGFLQRMIGYALTGDVREHVLAGVLGGGATGKSTFLGTIHTMMGDYATPAARGLLFRSHGERHPTELATLHGRRFVTCSEIEEGLMFDEALTKDLTGGDPINARRMREDEWTFQPTHKLFLAGNHKPTVRGDDEGIWRRMRLVPWTVTIPEADRDRGLPEKLRAELPGILAWAVRGCLAWQARGLEAPSVVTEATNAYRAENDGLGEFLRLAAVFAGDVTMPRRDLREAYEAYCTENGAEPLGAKRFAGRLRERGVSETTVRKGTSVVRGWRGVRLASEAEQVAASAWTERSHVDTCRQEIVIPPHARAHMAGNGETASTSVYVSTPGSEALFSDDLADLGIGGRE